MASVFQSIVYVQIRRRWVSVRVLSWAGGDSRWEGVPDVLIVRDRKGREVAIGTEAQPPVAYRLCRLLAHPRVLVESPMDLTKAMKFWVAEAGLKRSAARPVFVVHVSETLQGGLTELEQVCLRNVSIACGAGRVFIVESATEMHPPEVLALVKGRREAARPSMA